MNRFDKLNNSMETGTILENEKSMFQAKNGSIILTVLFILYVIIFAIVWIIFDKNLVVTLTKVLEISIVLIAISVYFRVAKKKLSDCKKIKKYNAQTQKTALTIIILVISIYILLFLLYILGFGAYK